MILFEGICEFFEFIAENDVYIQHIPGATGSHNRFSRLAKESINGQLSSLGTPRLEITDLPLGNLVDYGSSQMDNMTVRWRVIATLPDQHDYTEEITRLDNCKKACMRDVKYIMDQQDACTANEIICAFDVNSIKYELLDKTALDGKAVGCAMSFGFKENVDWETVSYGTFADTSKRKYTQMVTFDGIAAQNNYTASSVPDLEDMATWTLKAVMMGAMGIAPAAATWNGTTFALNSGITVEGGEYFVLWFEKEI
jgi:hypothetical protein